MEEVETYHALHCLHDSLSMHCSCSGNLRALRALQCMQQHRQTVHKLHQASLVQPVVQKSRGPVGQVHARWDHP